MTDSAPLRPATSDEIEQTLSYGLRFTPTGKSYRSSDELMSRIVAEILVDHLEQSGFVVMKKPPAPLPKFPNVKGYLTE